MSIDNREHESKPAEDKLLCVPRVRVLGFSPGVHPFTIESVLENGLGVELEVRTVVGQSSRTASTFFENFSESLEDGLGLEVCIMTKILGIRTRALYCAQGLTLLMHFSDSNSNISQPHYQFVSVLKPVLERELEDGLLNSANKY